MRSILRPVLYLYLLTLEFVVKPLFSTVRFNYIRLPEIIFALTPGYKFLLAIILF